MRDNWSSVPARPTVYLLDEWGFDAEETNCSTADGRARLDEMFGQDAWRDFALAEYTR